MPTSPEGFAAVAAQHGVDPNDDLAVDRFYETLGQQPRTMVDHVLSELLLRSCDCANADALEKRKTEERVGAAHV